MADLLSDLQSDSADTRFAAWRRAGEAPPSVIPQLGKLAASGNPGVAKAAREALSTMTHTVGKAGVAQGLLEIAGPNYTLPVRAHAFRLLSNIAAEDSVPGIARWIHDADLREEAVYCLERIPGAASIKALLGAYQEANDDFKPRILAALGHRRAAEAVKLCLEAMRSSNPGIAAAALKAFGRIGIKPATPFQFPASPADVDSMLRYAEAQPGEAMGIYRKILARPEEHLQCAAILGIAKLGTAAAAAAILPKLKSDNRTVRITAQNAWKKMAGA